MFTFYRDIAAHQLNQTLANSQTQTGTAIFAGGGSIDLRECLEQSLQFFLRDANARILNLKTEVQFTIYIVEAGYLHKNFSFTGEFNGVVNQVQ